MISKYWRLRRRCDDHFKGEQVAIELSVARFTVSG